ncbi:ubiquitin-conjugating enzyme/RWD-like protein [Trichoderma evansii]
MSASARSGAKRLIKEMENWRKEQKDEKGVERLGPVNEDDLFEWEAVINGKGIGSGYDEGRWLINIQLSTSYPLSPPKMRFVTQIIHPNIALQSGEICLDLLKDKWTPTYSVLQCVRAVRMLLGYPETDSPLNVDVAALLRGGDVVGTRKLVQYWCSEPEGRYDGP